MDESDDDNDEDEDNDGDKEDQDEDEDEGDDDDHDADAAAAGGGGDRKSDADGDGHKTTVPSIPFKREYIGKTIGTPNPLKKGVWAYNFYEVGFSIIIDSIPLV